MPATIPITQTKSLPELVQYTGPVALTDIVMLNLPAEHDSFSEGDYHVEVQGLYDAVITAPLTDYVPVAAQEIDENDNILVALAKLQAQIGSGVKAFVGITDILPTVPLSDNVFNRVKSDGAYILQSCTSTTLAVTVSVLAVTGTAFKPSVDVNGINATLSRNALTDVWEGDAVIVLSGPGPHAVTATHSDGNVGTAIVNMASGPVITGVVFNGAYPSVGQTEHASGQVIQLTVDADSDFVELVVTGGAVMPTTQTFAATQSKTINVVIANQGLTTTTQTASARVRNADGTWSAVVSSSAVAIPVDGVNTLELNNTRPTVSWGTVVYSSGFSALKDTETAIVSLTENNVDTVAWTSPTDELVITDPAVLGTKTVTRQSGDYNIVYPNIQVVVGRTANDTTATFARVVQIAHVDATLTITTPYPRLRSSVAGAEYTITATASQIVTDVALDVGAGGAFIDTWSTLGAGVWTNTIQIADSDVRGLTAYTAASVTNLAGKVNTDTPTGNAYTIGGFLRRTLVFPPFTYDAEIGTNVVDVTKLLVTNTARGPSGIPNVTYQADIIDGPNLYTITGPVFVANPVGNRLMLTDGGFVDNNTETAGVEIEETV